MKVSLIALFLVFSASAFAGVPQLKTVDSACGIVGAAVVDKELVVTLTDSQQLANKEVNYTIQNPMEFDWKAGSCVCLTGAVSPDPEYPQGEGLYNLMLVGDVKEDGAACDAAVPVEDAN